MSSPQKQNKAQYNRSLNARDTKPQGPRLLKPTPQNQQRMNYARFNSGTQSSETRPARQQTQDQVCGNCAFQHASGNCPAFGEQCRRCARIGHSAERVARRAAPLHSGHSRPRNNEGSAGKRSRAMRAPSAACPSLELLPATRHVSLILFIRTLGLSLDAC